MARLPHVDLSTLKPGLMMDIKAIDGEPAFCRVILYANKRANIERIGRATLRAAVQNIWAEADVEDFRDRRDTDFTFGPFDATEEQLKKLGFGF